MYVLYRFIDIDISSIGILVYLRLLPERAGYFEGRISYSKVR
jgi:hypothetical protein